MVTEVVTDPSANDLVPPTDADPVSVDTVSTNPLVALLMVAANPEPRVS